MNALRIYRAVSFARSLIAQDWPLASALTSAYERHFITTTADRVMVADYVHRALSARRPARTAVSSGNAKSKRQRTVGKPQGDRE